MRVAISGAGRVFERLYVPALRRSGLEVVAVADPAPGRIAVAGSDALSFATLDHLLQAVEVDGVIVLSPPAVHASDAGLALQRGLPVLVEKPMCQSPVEAEQLRGVGAEALLTPAFSRRYWPGYRRLAGAGAPRDLRIAIRVDPAGWDAHGRTPDIADDLFPHVADLARWLTGSEIAGITGRRRPAGVEVEIQMAGGAVVTARLDRGPAYREAVRADGRAFLIGPPSAAASLGRRLLRQDDPAVTAIHAMLADWQRRLEGGEPQLLPRFADGVASVAAMEALRDALA